MLSRIFKKLFKRQDTEPLPSPAVPALATKAPVKALAAKNPMDWTLTESSTPWKYNTYCKNCKGVTGHEERMADICNTCGHFDSRLGTRARVSRSIYTGSKWVTQHKYGNSEADYTLTE